MSPRLRGRAAWGAVILCVGAVMVLLAALPVGSVERSIVARGAGVVATIVFAWAVAGMPADVRLVWWPLWLFQALTVVADVSYDYLSMAADAVPFPSFTDVLYLGSYVAAFVGLWGLGRRVGGSRDLAAWLDTAIVTVAAASIMGVAFIGPMLEASGSPDFAVLLSIAYPVLDLAVLAALVRIMISARVRTPAVILLCSSVALFLVADIVYHFATVAGAPDDPPVIEPLWAGALLCMTCASLAPGAREFTAGARYGGAVSPARITAIGVGVITTPLLLVGALVRGQDGVARWLAMVTVLMVLLLLWRTNLLLRTVEAQARRLRNLANEDSLTGLANRRAWDVHVPEILGRAQAAGAPACVAMLDLDHFKAYNDTHGHQAGDAVLVSVAEAWSRCVPRGCLLARYGGEEFALVLPGRDEASATALAELVRRATPDPCTVSIGLAVVGPAESLDETISRADSALYRAKSLGRDRVVVSRGRIEASGA
jgi:diguanylate cyclase (GGDEF)-like protein